MELAAARASVARRVVAQRRHEPDQPPSEPTPAARLPLRVWLLVVVTYLGIACVVYANDVFASGTRLPLCACGDQVQEVWFLRWPLFALEHGHSLLGTNWLDAPTGVNLAINTTAPLLGVASTPLQLFLGPVETYDVLLVLALAGSAFALFAVLLRWVTRWPAAFVGGLLYGFSPFMIGQGEGHLFLTASVLPPVMLAVLDDLLVRRKRSARRDGLALGALAVAQYLISPEVLAMSAIVAGCGTVLLTLANWRVAVAAARRVLVAIVWCALVAGVLLAYPIWFSVLGPEHVIGPPHPLADLALYPGDLFGPVVPTLLQHFAPTALKVRGSALTGGDVVENGLYLGAPLLAVLAASTWLLRRARLFMFFAAMAAASTILALGPRLVVDGHNTHVRLPFTVLRHVPLLQDILPVRFSLFVQLFAAAALAVALDALAAYLASRKSGRNPASRLVPAVVALAALLPLVPQVPYPAASASVPALFTTASVDQIPAGSAVLTYPYPANPELEGMLWQAEAGMRFKILGGSAFVPGAGGASSFGPPLLTPTQVQAILSDTYAPPPSGPPSHLASYPPVNAATERTLAVFLRRYRISTIVVDPVGGNPAGVLRYLTAALGPGERSGPLRVWFHVPRLLATNPGPDGRRASASSASP